MIDNSKPQTPQWGSSNTPQAGKHPQSAPSSGLKNDLTAPAAPEVPTGGGAIRGIGEKFEANPATGTGSLTVPIALSEGRGSFTPALALRYDSGSGATPFGLGWSVGLPAITRKSDKGLPQYRDNPDNESDTFILAGAEDLVPVVEDGIRSRRTEGAYDVFPYQPRVEGLFSLIERWVERTTGIAHWRTVSRENIVALYGAAEEARLADPQDPRRIFSWMIREQWDAKGNLIRYSYKQEDGAGVADSCYERARLQKNAFTQKYLKEVSYGNQTPVTPSATGSGYNGAFLFRLVFDYGDHRTVSPQPLPNQTWTARSDAFSNYKAGFEIRTYRLCRRILMFHCFTELGAAPALVRATELDYRNDPSFSLLERVVHCGYDGGVKENLPPLTFSYAEPAPATAFKEVPADSLRHLPSGVDGGRYQWADLYSEGVGGILTMNDHAWYFKPNLGDRRFTDPEAESAPALGAMKSEIPKPAAANKRKTSFRLNDIDNDGLPELVVQGEGLNGFYSRDEAGKWLPFRHFERYPNLNFDDGNVRFMDLSGDGLADIVVSRGDCFDIYFSEGKRGFGAFRRVRCGNEAGCAPRILFSDPRQSVFLADMSGDGLTDIVRITHNSISYWPNMGYGRFGEMIAMGAPPLLDSRDAFDARFVHLADVDGSGTADLLYISKGKIRYFKNLSGNRWEEQALPAALAVNADPQTFVQLTDLMGNGTQCVVVSSSLPAKSQKMRYWELTGGKKPFLLTAVDNGMGGITRLIYAPSTKFYLQDKRAGKPWITKLGFPVHVVERIETVDCVAETTFVSRYAYHHGYFDPVEREFRGFGMVEQWDSEELEVRSEELGVSGGENSVNQSITPHPYDTPPAYSKSWFHTGFFRNREAISRQYAAEYWDGDGDAWLLDDTLLPAELSPEEQREACRALKGSVLRKELYALDGSDKEGLPYTVEEKNYRLQCLQGKHNNKYAIFLKNDNEQLSYHYERHVADPRILQRSVLQVDAYGNETTVAEVAYPRRIGALEGQEKALITVTENGFINTTDDFRMVGVKFRVTQYQLHNLAQASGQRISAAALLAAMAQAAPIDYATAPSATALQKRLIGDQRNYFWNAALTASLPLAGIAAHGAPYQQQTLELTQTLVGLFNAEGAKLTTAMLANECKYVQEGNYWYKPGTIEHYDAAKFYLPVKRVDPFGNETAIAYDSYRLFPVAVTDALGFVVAAEYDYRVVQPKKVTGPNGDSCEAAFDALGMVVKRALRGRNGEGDTLANPTERYDYDLHRWTEEQKPLFAYTAKRETHADAGSRWLERYSYSDGLGREIMSKSAAEDGLAWSLPDPEGDPVEAPTTHRWLASGKKILNNKGDVVKQYEPWYSAVHEFEDEEQLTHYGVTPVMYYDPLGRLIQTDFPDDTASRVAFDAWRQRNYDQNDCDAASPHHDTPQTVDFDLLGRPFRTTDDNGAAGSYVTRNVLDIAGRILQTVDAKGRVATQNRYTMTGEQPLAISNIDSGKRWAIPDAAGNIRYRWDGRGNRIRDAYDALLRPTERFLKAGTAAETLIQRTLYGTAAAHYNIGRPVEIQAHDGKTYFSYDFKGNIISLRKRFVSDYATNPNWNTVVLLGEEFATNTSYDALNRPISVTHPDNSVISYGYDKGGLLKQIMQGSTQYITNITYNARGQRENIYYGNNTKTRYYYNPLNFRLHRLLTTRNTGEVALQDLNYRYDSAGNIVLIRDDVQQTIYFSNSVIAPTSTFEYDALYRLTKATGRELNGLTAPANADFVNNKGCPNTASNAMRTYTHNYAYDQLGNIISDGWKSYIYDTATNRLLRHTGTTNVYTYDAHGNMTKMPNIATMNWDCFDRLISAANGTSFTSYYAYDAEGNRTRKVTVKGTVREERYYIGAYEVYRKYTNTTLNTERKSVNVADDEKVFLRKDGTLLRYQYDNHLGSACLELDHTGAIISYEEYHPFGTTSYRSGRSEAEVSLKRYKYCGKERDEETGLYYYGARYYAAWLGRFVSCDPLQHEQPNKTPYHYCSNNPVNKVDPTGMTDGKPPQEQQLFSERKFENFKFTGKNKDEEALFKEFLGTIAEGKVYEAVRNEMIKLEESGLEFMIRMDENITSQSGSGNFVYNKDTKQFDINIANSREFSEISRLAHELKHAFQYLEGKIAFEYLENHDQYSALYRDKTDEREALERQQLFDPKLNDDQIERMVENYSKLDWIDIRVPVDDGRKQMSAQNLNNMDNKKHPRFIYYGWEKDFQKMESLKYTK